MASQGAKIVIDYVAHPEATEALEKQLRDLGEVSIGVKADVSQISELKNLFDTAVKQFSRVDIMVTEHDLLSDQNGAFKLEHVYSFGVNVTAAKDGYITVSNDRGVWFWLIGGAKPDSMPTKDHPAVFRLQKKGPAPAKALPL